jgi:hypothetical protein
MNELSRQYQCDGLSVYGASLRCGAQLLVLELVIVKLVQTVGIKHRCQEFRMEMLVEDVARVEQLATTNRILRYAAAILDLATVQADAHVHPHLRPRMAPLVLRPHLLEVADHDAVDLLGLIKRAANSPLDTVGGRALANHGDREPQLAVIVVVVRDEHLVEQVELFDAGHELIDRLGLDRVLLICNSVCERAGKRVLA